MAGIQRLSFSSTFSADRERLKSRSAKFKSAPAEMEEALKGDWREEHLFVLQQSLESYRALQRQIIECDRAMEKVLEQVAVNPSAVPEAERPKNPVAEPTPEKKKRKKRTRGNAPQKDLTAQ